MRCIIVLLIVLLVVPGIANGQSETDFNFTNLSDGDTLADQFEDTALAKLYSFEASEGDVVTISMAQTSDELDPYLVLMGANGEVLAIDDDSRDDSGVLYSAQIQAFEIPSDGDYLILATTFEAVRGVYEPLREPLGYEVSITGNTPPSDSDTDTPTIAAEEVSSGDSMQLELSPEQPVYYLQFSGAAGQSVTLDMQGDFDTLLYLFDPNGVRVIANDDGDSSTNSRIENFELEEDGTYLIFATSYDFTFAADDDWSGGGEFIFSMQ